MSRLVYWIVGVISIVAIAALVFAVFFNQPTTTTAPGQSNNGFPDSRPAVGGQTGTPTTPTPAENTKTISGQGKSTIMTKDFLKDPETQPESPDKTQYFIGYRIDPNSEEAPAVPYVITYFPGSDFFNVALFQEPIKESREKAEQYLMTHLGIPQAQMCRLKYMVSVPRWVNATYTGTSLGFSFCPGATLLP